MTKIGLLSTVAIVGLGMAIWAMWPSQVKHDQMATIWQKSFCRERFRSRPKWGSRCSMSNAPAVMATMPVVDGLTRGDVTQIVEYIRTLQRANGIN